MRRIEYSSIFSIALRSNSLDNLSIFYSQFLNSLLSPTMLSSGNTEQVTDRLDRGLFDFAAIVEPPDLSKYNYIEVPEVNTWGVIM